jgi:RNA polymerase sigma-70 factor (ECF subfamily)
MRSALNAKRLPLSDDDPLPPDHDRMTGHVHLLDQIYRRERPGLMRFVSTRVRREDVEDIVHRAFVRLARRDAVEEIAAPGAYLREAARNLVLDDQRVEDRRDITRHIPLDEVEPLGCDTIKHLEARDRLVRIEAAMMALKPLTREIFLACRLDGYSYAEIAQRTGLSVRGVEKQMSRAIKKLGQHLRAHD